MLYCSNCGKLIERPYEYCSYCGTKLNSQENEVKFVRQERYRYCPNCGTKVIVRDNQELARCSSCGNVFELHSDTIRNSVLNGKAIRDIYQKHFPKKAEQEAIFTASTKQFKNNRFLTKAIQTSCPSCGRNINIQVNDKKDEFYCPYCGQLIQKSQVQAEKEARTALKRQKSEEIAAKEKPYIEKGKKWNRRGNITLGIVISWWIFVFYILLSENEYDKILDSTWFLILFLLQMILLPFGIIFKLIAKWKIKKGKSFEDHLNE